MPPTPSFTAVVVGAGFTRLDGATELRDRLGELARPLGMEDRVRVVLVERANTVGPDLGEEPRPLIERSLTQLTSDSGLARQLRS